MDQTHTPSDHPKLDALIAGYLEAVERGETPDRNQIMAENPDLATELRAFFDDLDHVQRAAASPNDGPAPNKRDAAHASTVIRSNNEPTPGVIIAGRYKLLENIGEGGMGSVWVAEQLKPVKRKVAIKLIKPGMDSKQVLARFEAERQALAVMDHPNIAKVFDGGLTEQGRPYFVMEYVKGVPFTDYCDRARLPLKDRLTLFIAVCSAVQHAHQKGIVHRDLKPSNILICLYDGHPVPKVIDFGLAKAMHQPLTEQSIFTGHGVMVGTPLYMSPEQAESNNLDIDTRTDIYSLGVVLYELLTGSTPLERQQLQKAAFDEVLRLIKEVEPPRPSLRLSGSDSLASIAAQRSIDPKQLSRSLAGDLDWIVMKTLDKERSRRYETANGLARDIERFLNEEPVEACPPSTAYRLKKYIKRHKGAVTAAGLILFALIVGIVGTTWGLQKARVAEAKTSKALDQVTLERDAKEEEKKHAESAQAAESLQRAKAEQHLVSGLIRPIGDGDKRNYAEMKSFVEWASLKDARLQLLAFEAIFEDPDLAIRATNQVESVTQSAVALSPVRHQRAIEIVSAKQRDANADPRSRVAACWFALGLGSTDLPALEEGVRLYCDPKNKLELLASGLLTFAISRSDPQQQGIVNTRVGDTLIDIISNANDKDVIFAAGNTMAEIAPRLNAQQATRAGNVLIDLLASATDYRVTFPSRDVLRLLAMRLSVEQASRGGELYINILETSDDPIVRLSAMHGLTALSSRLNPDQSHRTGKVIVVEISKGDQGLRSTARQLLTALASGMSGELLSQCWDTLVDRIGTIRETDELQATVETLLALAPYLNAEFIEPAWRRLKEIGESLEDSESISSARKVLVELSRRLSNDESIRCGDLLIDALSDPRNRQITKTACESLSALAPRLSPDQVEREGNFLIVLAKGTHDSDELCAVSRAIEAIAVRLTSQQIGRCGDVLVEKMSLSGSSYYVRHALAAIAPQLEQSQFNRVFDMLINDIKTNDLPSACYEISLMGPRLSSEQVMVAWDTLLGFLTKTPYYINMNFASVRAAIRSLAPRISPEAILRSGDELIRTTELLCNRDTMVLDNEAMNRLRVIGEVVKALAPRLTSVQRLRSAEALVKTMSRLNSRSGTIGVGRTVAMLTPLLEPESRDQVSNEHLTTLLDFRATSGDYFMVDGITCDYKQLRYPISAMSNPRSLAKVMSHPGCVEETREWMLMRFEELVLHQGQSVLLKVSDDIELGEAKKPFVSTVSVVETERKFHNMRDAVNWIQVNWPDFDLEYQHPVKWRSEN